MKTQELLELPEGTEVAVVGRYRDSQGVPVEANKMTLRVVRPKGHRTEVVCGQMGGAHEYLFTYAPRNIYGTYEKFLADRKASDERQRVAAAEVARVRVAAVARFEAAVARAAERGIEVRRGGLGYDVERVALSIEGLEALLGE